MKIIPVIFFCICCFQRVSSMQKDSIFEFRMYADVKITMDVPREYDRSRKTLVVLYALANGTSTSQTMGSKKGSVDDWRLNIQHIKAQTDFVRKELPYQNIVVVYLENDFKSWPLWKTKHDNYIAEIQHIVDTIYRQFSKRTTICLNGHSGGGRFIFGFLDGVNKIPSYVVRIAFLDSDYGYEFHYGLQIKEWLKANRNASLQVFAYDDSKVELNGKRIVSDTGGTWYRSHEMLEDISRFFPFAIKENDGLVVYKSRYDKVGFYFKTNPDKKIFHSRQVELNGFIHSILAGTKRESLNYKYYREIAYRQFIE